MEKSQIAEMLAPFALSAQTAKSATNRVESALSKQGTPAQLLSGIALSMRGLRDKVDENSSDYGSVLALETAFTFATAIAKKGSEKATKTREVWADTQEEAQAIKAAQKAVKPTKPAKPAKKTKSLNETVGEYWEGVAESNALEALLEGKAITLEALVAALAARR